MCWNAEFYFPPSPHRQFSIKYFIFPGKATIGWKKLLNLQVGYKFFYEKILHQIYAIPSTVPFFLFRFYPLSYSISFLCSGRLPTRKFNIPQWCWLCWCDIIFFRKTIFDNALVMKDGWCRKHLGKQREDKSYYLSFRNGQERQ